MLESQFLLCLCCSCEGCYFHFTFLPTGRDNRIKVKKISMVLNDSGVLYFLKQIISPGWYSVCVFLNKFCFIIVFSDDLALPIASNLTDSEHAPLSCETYLHHLY